MLKEENELEAPVQSGSQVDTLKVRRRRRGLGKSPSRRQGRTHRDSGALGQLTEGDPDAPGTRKRASPQYLLSAPVFVGN